MNELTEEQIAELTKEFQKELEEMLWSSISLSALVKEIETKPIEIELEYTNDYTYFQNRLYFSMPYPKSSWMGFVNITS